MRDIQYITPDMINILRYLCDEASVNPDKFDITDMGDIEAILSVSTILDNTDPKRQYTLSRSNRK